MGLLTKEIPTSPLLFSKKQQSSIVEQQTEYPVLNIPRDASSLLFTTCYSAGEGENYQLIPESYKFLN